VILLLLQQPPLSSSSPSSCAATTTTKINMRTLYQFKIATDKKFWFQKDSSSLTNMNKHSMLQHQLHIIILLAYKLTSPEVT
jgi:hypothetical protein